MDLKTLTFLVVGATFALYIGIAIWARAGTTKEFYVAGTGVHPIANGMATAADWMPAASFISMAGLIAFLGYDASVYLMGWGAVMFCWPCCWLLTCVSLASSRYPSLSVNVTTQRLPGWWL